MFNSVTQFQESLIFISLRPLVSQLKISFICSTLGYRNFASLRLTRDNGPFPSFLIFQPHRSNFGPSSLWHLQICTSLSSIWRSTLSEYSPVIARWLLRHSVRESWQFLPVPPTSLCEGLCFLSVKKIVNCVSQINCILIIKLYFINQIVFLFEPKITIPLWKCFSMHRLTLTSSGKNWKLWRQ